MKKNEKNNKKLSNPEAILWLLKPLRLEMKQGCTDRAVAGGIGKWLPLVQEKLIAQAFLPEKESAALLKPLQGYVTDSPEERKVKISAIFSSVEKLGTPTAQSPSEAAPAVEEQPKEDERVTELGMPVQYLKGVGPKRAGYLRKINIDSVMDLLCHYPREWQDRTQLSKIHQVKEDEHVTICGKVRAKQTFTIRRGLNITKVILDDQTGQIAATWFNQPYMRERFEEGQWVLAYGKVSFSRSWQIMNPDFEILEGSSEDQIHTGRIAPMYPLTERISQRVMRSMLYSLVQHLPTHFPDVLPDAVVKDQAFPAAKVAYQDIHFPPDFPALDQARRRLVFEELFLQQIAVARMRVTYGRVLAKALQTQGAKVTAFLEALPFSLTEAQDKALKKIFEDLGKPHPMHRLLQGDVGSGKTVVGAAAMLAAVDSGVQAALMAPTEILATQHYLVLKKYFEPLGITLELLTSGVKAVEKKRIHAGLADGTVAVLIGTHALTQEIVAFKTLGLVVVDEQHRFGVEQRALLRAKGEQPHTLVMTATPIPRTLALTAYGDLDVTVLDESPPGRMPISTQALAHGQSRMAYEKMNQAAQAGRQGYIIFPLIDESEKLDLKALTREYARLEKHVFTDKSLGLLHGRMTTPEKEIIMAAFKSGKIQILASTTVVEVGVDIPNATVMIIENADRFGLATLHQLRGRIGRGRHASYCYLIADPSTEEGRARLRIMCAVKDGFQLAEEDLALRGPGEFFGLRQHGLPDLKLANLIRDAAQIEIAKEHADRIIAKDRELELDENQALREAYFALYQDRESRARVG
ncbi:ATP-dependent DNA helicase RecG [bacterium]|nr:ATP-dependent DNA helicase RecG [bacterium]